MNTSFAHFLLLFEQSSHTFSIFDPHRNWAFPSAPSCEQIDRIGACKYRYKSNANFIENHKQSCIGAIQVLRNADGGGGIKFLGKSFMMV